MELKVGMYIITNDRMKIGQIKGFCTCEMCEKRGFYEPIIDGDIIITDYDKSQGFHGYRFYDNPIDLIEVGDYVNGDKVTEEMIKMRDEQGVFGLPDKHRVFIDEIKVKNIVTKEQFNYAKYEVI